MDVLPGLFDDPGVIVGCRSLMIDDHRTWAERLDIIESLRDISLSPSVSCGSPSQADAMMLLVGCAVQQGRW